MPLMLRFVGEQRKALLKLFSDLDALSLGVGKFAPGCELDEEEGMRLDMAKAVVRSLIDQTLKAGEESKAGGLAPGGREG